MTKHLKLILPLLFFGLTIFQGTGQFTVVEDLRMSLSPEVTSDTDGSLESIEFSDQVTDVDGNSLAPGMFTISSVTSWGLNDDDLTQVGNGISGTIDMASNSVGTISGTLNGNPAGNVVTNTVSVEATDIVNESTGNHTAVLQTPVTTEGVDLVASLTVDSACLDSADGNQYTLIISNVGTDPVDLTAFRTMSFNAVLPVGVTATVTEVPTGWNYHPNYLNFTSKTTFTLGPGMSLPPFRFTLNASTGYTISGDITATAGKETPGNVNNNNASITITAPLTAPAVSTPVYYYCLNETPTALTATAGSGNQLIWYLNPGGSSSSTAFTPNTDTAGSTTYYVSQSNGSCESELAAIEVNVLDAPNAGSVGGEQEICNGSIPSLLTSTAPGTGPGALSYRWETSSDNQTTWSAIAGATAATYQPGAGIGETHFRRISVLTNASNVCESVPTNVLTVQVTGCGVITNPMLPSKAN